MFWALLALASAPTALCLATGLRAGTWQCRQQQGPASPERHLRKIACCKKMGGDCHSPSDCHSLIISGQRGWKYSLSLSNFADAVVMIVAKD